MRVGASLGDSDRVRHEGSGSLTPSARAAAPLAAVALLCALTGWSGSEAMAAWAALRGPAPQHVETAVVALAATGAAAVAAWLALGTLVSTLTLLAGRRRHPLLVPAAVHRATAVLLGVTLVAGAGSAAAQSVPTGAPGAPPATPAAAATATATAAADLDPAWTAAAAASLDPLPDPGWRPAAPPKPPRTVAEPIDPVLLAGRHQPPDPQHLVTVRRGDTLWDLAARALGPDAADAEVAAEWPRWYAANRDVLGPDPDLLLPGQQLVPPDG